MIGTGGNQIDFQKLKDVEFQRKYNQAFEAKLSLDDDLSIGENWKRTAEACKEAAEEVLGRIERTTKCDDEDKVEWSKRQKKLRDDIEASRNKEDRGNMKKERNEILAKIHRKLQRIEEKKILEKIEDIERHKDDSNRMYQVMRQLQTKDNNKIIVNAENGVTASEKKQVEIVTDYRGFGTLSKKYELCVSHGIPDLT